jgi:hypothetical protein
VVDDDGAYGVVLDNGREVQAQFAGAADGQQALIVEDEPVSVAVSEITVVPPPPPYYERVSRADLNMTLNDGNTDSRNTLLFADTRMRFGVHRHLGDMTFAREEVNGVDTKKQDLVRYEYNRLLDNSWYWRHHNMSATDQGTGTSLHGGRAGRPRLLQRRGQLLTASPGPL